MNKDIYSPCRGPGCTSPGRPVHHRFPQHNVNVRTYGRALIDASWNIAVYCDNCHTSHRNMRPDDMWKEQRFRDEAKRRGHELPRAKKSCKGEG